MLQAAFSKPLPPLFREASCSPLSRLCLPAFNPDCLPEGGNTLLPGLPERLQAEVGALEPSESGKVVRVSSPQDRVFSVWRGGAALANLTSLVSSWISQEEYEENGPQIVFRKCF